MNQKTICRWKDCQNEKIEQELCICSCCLGKFCSKECVNLHMMCKRYEKIKNTTKNEQKGSTFIKNGEILGSYESSSYFKIENFQKVELGHVKQILGSGAFGHVYLIKHKLTGELFALKQIDKRKLRSMGVTEELVKREIKNQLCLIHENIARLYSYHEDENYFYLIIEYVQNGTLFGLIQKNQGLSEEEAFRYFIQIAAAVHFLHLNGLMHRDLKPENCLLDNSANVKICDFGWTAGCNEGDRTTFCGTFEYMAPEIIKERPYNKSVDLWSLGVLLYELLHSYSPFRSKRVNARNDEQSSCEVLQNIVKYNFSIDKRVSMECKDLLMKLLSPKTENRIGIDDLFNHPWVRKFEEDNKIRDDKTMTQDVKASTSTNDKLFDCVIEQIQKNNQKSLNLNRSSSCNDMSIFNDGNKNILVCPSRRRRINKFSPIRQQIDCGDDTSAYSMYKDMKEIERQIEDKNKKLCLYVDERNKLRETIDKENNLNEMYKFKTITTQCDSIDDGGVQHGKGSQKIGRKGMNYLEKKEKRHSRFKYLTENQHFDILSQKNESEQQPKKTSMWSAFKIFKCGQ